MFRAGILIMHFLKSADSPLGCTSYGFRDGKSCHCNLEGQSSRPVKVSGHKRRIAEISCVCFYAYPKKKLHGHLGSSADTAVVWYVRDAAAADPTLPCSRSNAGLLAVTLSIISTNSLRIFMVFFPVETRATFRRINPYDTLLALPLPLVDTKRPGNPTVLPCCRRSTPSCIELAAEKARCVPTYRLLVAAAHRACSRKVPVERRCGASLLGARPCLAGPRERERKLEVRAGVDRSAALSHRTKTCRTEQVENEGGGWRYSNVVLGRVRVTGGISYSETIQVLA